LPEGQRVTLAVKPARRRVSYDQTFGKILLVSAAGVIEIEWLDCDRTRAWKRVDRMN
jgi:hypothetical protein